MDMVSIEVFVAISLDRLVSSTLTARVDVQSSAKLTRYRYRVEEWGGPHVCV